MNTAADVEGFLSRVVPVQGNYLTITWKGEGRGWASRSFPPAQVSQAASWLRWASSIKADAYFAVASYNVAEIGTSQKGEPTIRAKREQANVHLIRTLVIDADVKRDGDKKDATKVFHDRSKAIEWLKAFTKATGLPMPSMWVNSGYGFHWYWILETAITLGEWQPMADALREAMVAHGWVGDTAPTVDGARIMRPPGTFNFKSGQPVAVEGFPKLSANDYANADIMAKLTPWIGVQKARATGTHGGATVTSIGPRPSYIPPGGPGLNQSARIESRFQFAEIAKRCEQIKLSLAKGGEGDPYPLWYLGNISMAVHTRDGKDFIHPISKDHADYDADKTEAAFARAEKETDGKVLGAPTCKHYDMTRPGVCGACPFKDKITSPLSLGVDVEDLPYKYRRVVLAGETAIQRMDGKGEDAEWVFLFFGDVAKPRLDELPTGGHRLSFTYKLAGRDYPVAANEADMTTQIQVGYFSKQGVAVTRHTAAHAGDFVMAWISQLRLQQTVKTEVVRPFGWNIDARGNRIGVAIAGTLYKTDGSIDKVPGGDPKIAAMYRPAGDMANWRKAAALFEGGRPDCQGIIATSFGAVLISLCGDVRGMTMSFWSTESGIGKSTAIKVGQSVWGDPRSMQSMQDTPNAVMKSLSEPRILIRYWDELRVRKDYQDAFVEMIFTIPQGKERSRMNSDTTLREVGEWETMLVFTSNRPCQDYLLARDDGTDSGLARLLEVEMAKIPTAFDPMAGQSIKLCETNYGHAGRVYLQYVATHLQEVQNKLSSTMKMLSDGLKMQRDERFSVTAMACTLVGAYYGRKLGLFNFDVPGILGVLKTAFLAQRESRATRTMVAAAGGLDVEEIVNGFVYSQADYRLRTDNFSSGGAGKVTMSGVPRGNVVRLQIATAAKILRVNRAAFNEWLHSRGLPATVIIKQLVDKMGAVQHRKSLGGGTGFAGGVSHVIDIPLTGRLADIANSVNDDAVAALLRKSPSDASK
jgi:hypothetical protein